MESVYQWAIVVMLIIGVVGVIKIITLAARNQNTHTNTTNNQAIRPLNPAAAPRTGTNETGLMVYYANDHHGRRDKEYQFNYKKVGGSWRAYILRMPSLGIRDSSGAVTHRLYDNGRPYVCWDRSVNSLKDMQTISRVWADNIQEYIATGKRFG